MTKNLKGNFVLKILLRKSLLVCFCALLALAAGILLQQSLGLLKTNPGGVFPVREKGEKYKYINPLLTFETTESTDLSSFASLKKEFEKIVKNRVNNGDAKNISVYFRGLIRGNWIGVNTDTKYAPASLLKVPTMIAFYKLAESNPETLSRVVTYTEPFDNNEASHFAPQKSLKTGQSYTIEELIRYLILYSDNNAARLLHQNIKEELLDKVYTDLALDAPESGTAINFMTPTQYSYFFRILYNATYLNRDYSEKALGLLSASDFPQGIVAGVPLEITVAHKFGERTVFLPNGTASFLELHDCGIIYYPRHPYLLCVMSEGDNFDVLTSIIKEVSEKAYQARKNQFPNP